MRSLLGLPPALVPAPPSLLLFSPVLRVPALSTSGLEALCRPVWGFMPCAAAAPWFHSRPRASPFSSTPHPTARMRPNWELKLSSPSACDLLPSSTPARCPGTTYSLDLPVRPPQHWGLVSFLASVAWAAIAWKVMEVPRGGGLLGEAGSTPSQI